MLTSAQVEARRGRFTSTRVVKLVRGQKLALWNEMLGYAAPVENARMRAGTRLERAIIEWAAEERGWSDVTYQPGTIVSRIDPLFATSPDALVWDSMCVEAKNRGGERSKEYDGGEPLQDEIVQATWHMGVTERPKAAIAVLLGGNDLRIFDLNLDAEFFGGIVEMARQFKRDHLDTGKPPPLDDPAAADDYLRARFPKDTAPVLEADAALADLAHRYWNVRREREHLEKSEGLLAAELKAAMGNAAGLVGPDFRISWKATKPVTKTDWESLAAELNPPTDLIAKHSRTVNGARRFLPTFKETT